MWIKHWKGFKVQSSKDQKSLQSIDLDPMEEKNDENFEN